MQNNLMACEGPRQAEAAHISRGGARRRRFVRGLLAVPLALALSAPTTALAQETSKYGSETVPVKTTPSTTPSTTPGTTTSPSGPAPKQETGPTKTSSTAKETPAPSKAAEPSKSATEPTATTAAKASKTLPFTGIDLRWITLGGVLLVAMGGSILLVQRRRDARR